MKQNIFIRGLRGLKERAEVATVPAVANTLGSETGESLHAPRLLLSWLFTGGYR